MTHYFKPFPGLRPKPELLDDIIAPPYDVINSAEAKQYAEHKPYNFLRITKPEINSNQPIDSKSAYQLGRKQLEKLLSEQVLNHDSESFYLYRISQGDWAQLGVVAAVDCQAYDNGLIKKHELTRTEKEDDRVELIRSLNAQVSPVLLTYREKADLSHLLDELASAEPVARCHDDKGFAHCLWQIADPKAAVALQQALSEVASFYVADGHHRTSASSRVAKQLAGKGSKWSSYFLAVLFADTNMHILPYNRHITLTESIDSETLLKNIKQHFDVTPKTHAVSPDSAEKFGLFLNGQWHQLSYRNYDQLSDPVSRIPVSVLHDYLIEPIFAITDPRKDPRIDFVGGDVTAEELAKRVSDNQHQVVFTLYPTSMQQLLDVADADRLIPPKSTWFEPKLLDGLVSFIYD